MIGTFYNFIFLVVGKGASNIFENNCKKVVEGGTKIQLKRYPKKSWKIISQEYKKKSY